MSGRDDNEKQSSTGDGGDQEECVARKEDRRESHLVCDDGNGDDRHRWEPATGVGSP